MEQIVNSNKGVQHYFEKWAQQFDGLYDLNKQSRFESIFNSLFRKAMYERVDLTFQAMGNLQGKTVLDVGCGSGRQLMFALNQGADKAVGIDFSKDMLDMAASTAEKHGSKDKIELIQGDFNQHAFPSKYNCAYALGFFDYIANPLETLRKMCDLSTELVVATFPKPTLLRKPLRKLRYSLRGCPLYFYTPKQLDELVSQVGFKRYEIKEFGHCGLICYGYKS